MYVVCAHMHAQALDVAGLTYSVLRLDWNFPGFLNTSPVQKQKHELGLVGTEVYPCSRLVSRVEKGPDVLHRKAPFDPKYLLCHTKTCAQIKPQPDNSNAKTLYSSCFLYLVFFFFLCTDVACVCALGLVLFSCLIYLDRFLFLSRYVFTPA